MFDLLGKLKSLVGTSDNFGDGMAVPKSVQDAIDIRAVYPDGIFLVGKDRYSKVFKFTDINYAVASKEDKETDFFKYSDILNSLENGVSSQLTIINRRIKSEELNNLLLTEKQNDGKDVFRREINEMLTGLATVQVPLFRINTLPSQFRRKRLKKQELTLTVPVLI